MEDKGVGKRLYQQRKKTGQPQLGKRDGRISREDPTEPSLSSLQEPRLAGDCKCAYVDVEVHRIGVVRALVDNEAVKSTISTGVLDGSELSIDR